MKLLGKTFKCKMKIMGENTNNHNHITYTNSISIMNKIHISIRFYSLSNVFSYRKHISSKSNISVLTISGKSRNIKIIAPFAPILLSTLPFYGILSIFPDGHFIMTPPHFEIFFQNTHLPVYSNPCTIKLRRVTE